MAQVFEARVRIASAEEEEDDCGEEDGLECAAGGSLSRRIRPKALSGLSRH